MPTSWSPGQRPAVDARRGPGRRGQHRRRLHRRTRGRAAVHRRRASTSASRPTRRGCSPQRGMRVHVVPSKTHARPDPRAEARRRLPLQRARRPGHRGRRGAAHPEVLGAGIPLFGICFGNQILGRALGRGTYKMKFGHRGINIPVIEHDTGRISITAQNHGFALEGERGEQFDTPFGTAEVSHTCANDGAVGGRPAARRPGVLGAVPPRGRRRSARRRVPVRPFRRSSGRSRECLAAPTSSTSWSSGPARS